MTEEDKELLLKDLSARLPYGVKVDHFGTVRELLGIIPSSENVMVGYDINDYEDSVIEDIKPYLRPMSSMTEKEKNEHFGRTMTIDIIQTSKEVIDWLNKKMFDYRGLIEKGLAIAVTEDKYVLTVKQSLK